ncbi:MAG: hypothetical protein QOH01_3565 [Verrucomicrobiota bacterium]|jgi:hypothetical protein
MKTLIATVAALTLSFTTLSAKEGAFTSVIIPEAGKPLQFELSAHQWIKITNFVQNDTDDRMPADFAGIAVYKGDNGVWVLFATKTNVPEHHDDLIVGGPATVIVHPPAKDAKMNKGGAAVFLTYQRGSD